MEITKYIYYLYVIFLSDLKKFRTKILQHYYLSGALLVINCFSFLYLTIHTDETDYTIELVSNIMTYTNVISLLFIIESHRKINKVNQNSVEGARGDPGEFKI